MLEEAVPNRGTPRFREFGHRLVPLEKPKPAVRAGVLPFSPMMTINEAL